MQRKELRYSLFKMEVKTSRELNDRTVTGFVLCRSMYFTPPRSVRIVYYIQVFIILLVKVSLDMQDIIYKQGILISLSY